MSDPGEYDPDTFPTIDFEAEHAAFDQHLEEMRSDETPSWRRFYGRPPLTVSKCLHCSKWAVRGRRPCEACGKKPRELCQSCLFGEIIDGQCDRCGLRPLSR